ncbi:MAG: DMT family transporter [Tannerellaceae bacterium]|nr:DMT family transporter [Tannerellaceae bacterium]
MNSLNRLKGFLYALLTSVTFGLIPLFTLPLMAKGIGYDSILFYRFTMAALVLVIIMFFKKESFQVKRGEIPFLILLGIFYTISALFLFWGYTVMSAGIATTLHFTYPVFVTLLMVLFFREKASATTNLAILAAIDGVASLSIDSSDTQISLTGILLVLLSAVGYALYIVTVNKSQLRTMSGRKLTLYAFMVSAALFLIKAGFHEGIQSLPDQASLLNVLLLAILPTVVSNIALIQAVRYLGGTLTSIMGAMEPVTAVCVGVVMFNEPLTFNLIVGILLIIGAVLLIILSKTLAGLFKKR